MERFDLYTADREKTGRTVARGDKTPEGFYRLVVHVCLFDGAGRMLIQRRQPFKKGWPGLWDFSVGGHAVAGDSSRAAAVREAREELGLALDLTGIRPALSLSFEQGFDDFYLLTRPLDPSSLSLQREEVAEVRWAEEEEILRRIGDGSFIPYEKGLISLLFCLWSRRDAHTKDDPTRGETHADGGCGGIVLFK